MGMRRGTGLPQASPAPTGRLTRCPVGVGVRSTTRGLGLSSAWVSARACWQQVPLLDPGRLLPVSLTCRDSTALCSFPALRPQGPTRAARHRRPFLLRVVATTSMFTRWSGCITCRVSPADGERGPGSVAPWAVTHTLAPARCLSVASVPRKHVVGLSWSRAAGSAGTHRGALLAVACSTQPLSLSCTQGWRGCPWMCRPWWTSGTRQQGASPAHSH